MDSPRPRPAWTARMGARPETARKQGELFGPDPLAGVTDPELHGRLSAREADFDATSARRELHRVGHEVPDDLLQAVRIAETGVTASSRAALERDPLGFGRRAHGLDGRLDHRQHRSEVTSRRSLPGRSGRRPAGPRRARLRLELRWIAASPRAAVAASTLSVASTRTHPAWRSSGLRSSWETAARNSSLSRPPPRPGAHRRSRGPPAGRARSPPSSLAESSMATRIMAGARPARRGGR